MIQTIVNIIGWIGVVLIGLAAIIWLWLMIHSYIDPYIQSRKTNKYTYDDMFDAYMAGIEKIDPYHKAQNPAWFTLLGSEFIVFMKKIKK